MAPAGALGYTKPMTTPPLAQLYAQAATLHEQGRLDQAEAGYRQILAIDPRQADTLHLYGILMIQTGRIEPGLAMVERALSILPGFIDAHFNRATALMQVGRLDATLDGFDKTLALRPDHLGAVYSRALTLAQLQRLADALAGFDRFLALQPGHPDALLNRGVTLDKLGRWAEALDAFDRVLRVQPQDAQAQFNRGGVLKQLGRLEEAQVSFAQALALRPDWPDALVNHGVALKMLGRPAEALRDYDKALAAAPGHVRALISRGAARADLGRFEEALADYDQALALEPGSALAAFNRGVVLLQTGRFEEGWPGYERRKDLPGAASRAVQFAQPEWDGRTPLEGKTLFLRWEQGLGDTIQFCRYARMAADRGARVILSVQDGLRPLLEGFDPRVAVIGANETPERFDLHAALMSLPGAFGTALDTMPSAEPYLPLTEPYRDPAARPLIGLVWSGATGHENDRNRSAPLASLAPLLDFDADWFCLQKDIQAPDRETLNTLPRLQHPEDRLAGFPKTAALIASLDLVISVDTSIAHLAAAMGKPVWVLLSSAPDWRWLTGRADSPWYETVRLFRQARPRDWAGVVDQVRIALADRFAYVGSPPSAR